jgi:PilZ domain
MKRLNPSLDDDAQEQLGVLKRERAVRLLNCSVSGCLIETNWQLQVGTIATLRVVIDGHELADDVQVTRCQPIAGAGDTFHIGAQFLWTQPLHKQSLRRAHGASSTITQV